MRISVSDDLPRGDFMSIKVLLVDDERDFVEPLSERLQTRGFTTGLAFNGDEAIGLVEKDDWDVVILDVLMPGKDGTDTLREIKKIKPLIEVIMLTGHATVESAIEGMKLGAYDYLMKPTDLAELVSKIKKARVRKEDQEERIRQAEINHIVKTRGW
jgi:two-component system, OmpR family, response regulator CpxR